MYDLLASGPCGCDHCDEGGIFLWENRVADYSLKDLRTAAQDYLADHLPGQKNANFDRIERAVRE